MNDRIIEVILGDMYQATPKWKELIAVSFLSDEMKEKYLNLLESRLKLF